MPAAAKKTNGKGLQKVGQVPAAFVSAKSYIYEPCPVSNATYVGPFALMRLRNGEIVSMHSDYELESGERWVRMVEIA